MAIAAPISNDSMLLVTNSLTGTDTSSSLQITLGRSRRDQRHHRCQHAGQVEEQILDSVAALQRDQ